MTSSVAAEIVAALAQSTGSIEDGGSCMTFPEVAAAVEELAEAFDRSGIAPEDCVSLGCDNSVASAVLLLALLRSGRSFVLRPHGGGASDKAINTPAPATFCRFVLQAGRLGHARHAIDLKTTDISVAIARSEGWRSSPSPGSPSYYLPTSGSTGPAKLVRHLHDRFLSGCRNCVERLGLSSSDRIAVPVPLSHMYGLRAAFAPGLIAGATIDLQADANALRFLARERDFVPSVAFLTPSFAETVLALRRSPRAYRLTVMAGDGLTPNLFERYEAHHGPVVNLYGSTELGAVAAGDLRVPPEIRRGAIGPFLSGVSPCPAAALPPGGAESDLLWFQHEGGFLGYVDAEGREVWRADGFRSSGTCHCSGDVGFVVDGRLTVTGRADDRVKRDGVFVACADVAAALRGIDGLEQVVVLAGGMTRRGRALIAICVPDATSRWSPAALRRVALGFLPPHAVPDRFVLLPDLPRLATGKIDRQELRRRHVTPED